VIYISSLLIVLMSASAFTTGSHRHTQENGQQSRVCKDVNNEDARLPVGENSFTFHKSVLLVMGSRARTADLQTEQKDNSTT
jgi:hypothetical protein